MAFNMIGGAGGRRTRGLPAMSDINVTPFVDVVLVLLIIFIITAHVMDYGIEVDVPKTKAVTSSSKDLPVVLLSKTGDLYLGSSSMRLPELVSAIHSRYPGQTDVYVRAAGKATWDELAQVAAELGAAKFNLKFVTQPDTSGPRR